MPHPCERAPTLAAAGPRWPPLRRSPRRHRALTLWRTRDMVPPNGDNVQARRVPSPDSRPLTSQQVLPEGDGVPVPPGAPNSQRHLEDGDRRLEWLPERAPAPVWQAPDHLHHAVRTLALPTSPTRLPVVRRWLQPPLRLHPIIDGAQGALRGRYHPLRQRPGRALVEDHRVLHPRRAGRHRPQSRQIPFRWTERRLRRLQGVGSNHRAAPQISRRHPGLPLADVHHRRSQLVRPRKPGV